MKKRSFLMYCLVLYCAMAAGSRSESGEVSVPFSKAIEDNSFLIEEAYNQEDGVVQHISNGIFFSQPENEFVYSFTQEWPLFSQMNQLSSLRKIT